VFNYDRYVIFYTNKNMSTSICYSNRNIASRAFVQILVDSTNKRRADLTREVQDLKNSLQFSQGEVDVLKETCSKMATNCKSP
jgi:hypothetical protein